MFPQHNFDDVTVSDCFGAKFQRLLAAGMPPPWRLIVDADRAAVESWRKDSPLRLVIDYVSGKHPGRWRTVEY